MLTKCVECIIKLKKNPFLLSIFNVQLYNIIKGHFDNKSVNVLIPVSSQGYFICTILMTDRIIHTTTLCYTSCGALTRTRNSLLDPPRRIELMAYCTKVDAQFRQIFGYCPLPL